MTVFHLSVSLCFFTFKGNFSHLAYSVLKSGYAV